MSLSSLIVHREIATVREVEEALARQVLYGGDLVTNLLEVTRLDEAQITPLLAESFSRIAAPSGELPAPSEEARALVPAEMAAGRGMVPLSSDMDRLVLAVAEPLPRELEEELAFALGRAIEQRIAPSFRVRQAISRVYDVPLERRVQRLLARIAGDEGSHGSLPPILRAAPPVTEPPRLPDRPLSHKSAEMPAVYTPRSAITNAGFPAPPSMRPQAPSVRPAPIPEPSPIPTTPEGRPTSQSPRATLQRGSAENPRVVTPRPTRRRRGPLTPDAAKTELEEAADRDAILDLFFDFSRQFFDYAALFLVQADLAEGRDAFGDGAPRDRVVAIGVPLDLPSLLSKARDRREPVLSPPSHEGLDLVLLADLQRTTQAPILVVPVVVRKRAVALFFGDSGEAGVDEESAKIVIGFAASIGQAFERIIVRKKLQGIQSTSNEGLGEPSKTPSRAPPTIVSPRAQSTPPASRERAPYSTPRSQRGEVSIVDAFMGVEPGPPPPENVAIARRPSGRPIPREEPFSTQAPSIEPSTVDTRGIAARMRAAEDAARTRSDVDQALRATANDEPLVDKVVVDVEVIARKTAPPPAPPIDAGSASQAVSIAAHRPPSSRVGPPPELPSVIVDVDAEFATLVDRFTQPGGDEHAEAELLRQGQSAMPAIMQRFPGPITIEPDRLALLMKWDGTGVSASKEPLPRVNECGPVLRVIAGQRRVALPFVLAHLEDEDADKRFWATFLLTELAYAEGAQALVPRLFDDEPRTRRVARLAARAVAEVAPRALIEHLGKIILASTASREKRVTAIDTLNELREPIGVPVLVGVLADTDEAVGVAALRALVSVTHQDFEQDQPRWMGWWSVNGGRHRIEWLIDALMHDDISMRHAAGEELKALTKEYFGYYDDLPKRERERAQQRYRDWWTTEGRLRFRRD